MVFLKNGSHEKEEAITNLPSKDCSPDKEYPQKGYDLHVQRYKDHQKSLEDV